MAQPSPDKLLLFRIGGLAFAVDARQVDSVALPPADLTHPPGSEPAHPGIFHAAGVIHQVVDPAAQWGIDREAKGGGRLLLYHDGQRHQACRVDEVVGLTEIERGRWVTLPPYLPRSVFSGGFLCDDRIWLFAELDALVRLEDHGPLRRHLAELAPGKADAPEMPPAASAESAQTAAPPESAPPGPAAPAGEPEWGSESPSVPEAPQAPTTPPLPHHAPPVRPAAPKKPSPQSAPPVEPPPPSRPPAPESPPLQSPEPAPAVTPPPQTAPPSPENRTADPAPNSPTTTATGDLGLLAAMLLLPATVAVALLLWWQPWQVETETRTAVEMAPRMVTPAPRLTPAVPEVVASANDTSSPAPLPVPEPAVPPPTPPAAPVPAPPPVESPRVHADPPPEAAPAPIEHAPQDNPQAPADLLPDVPVPDREPREMVVRVPREALLTAEIPASGPLPEVESAGTGDPDTTATPASDPVPPPATAPSANAATHPMPTEPADPAPDPGQPAATPTVTGEPPPIAAPRQPPPLPHAAGTAVHRCNTCRYEYTVVRGDTLWSIAKRYLKNPYRFRELAEASGVRNPHLIYPGDRIIIEVY